MDRDCDLSSLFSANTNDIGTTISVLMSLGISVVDDRGEFRSLHDVLNDISKKAHCLYSASAKRVLVEAADTLIHGQPVEMIITDEALDNAGESALDSFLHEFCITSTL